MPSRAMVCLAITLPAITLLGGCAAAALAPAAAAAQAAGSGFAFWEGNKFRQAIPSSAEEVSAALDAEIESLDLQIVQDYGIHADDGSLTLRVVRIDDDDEHIGTVRIERMTDRLTYAVMTVRFLGKKAAVGLLMDRVSRRAVASHDSAPESLSD